MSYSESSSWVRADISCGDPDICSKTKNYWYSKTLHVCSTLMCSTLKNINTLSRLKKHRKRYYGHRKSTHLFAARATRTSIGDPACNRSETRTHGSDSRPAERRRRRSSTFFLLARTAQAPRMRWDAARRLDGWRRVFVICRGSLKADGGWGEARHCGRRVEETVATAATVAVLRLARFWFFGFAWRLGRRFVVAAPCCATSASLFAYFRVFVHCFAHLLSFLIFCFFGHWLVSFAACCSFGLRARFWRGGTTEKNRRKFDFVFVQIENRLLMLKWSPIVQKRRSYALTWPDLGCSSLFGPLNPLRLRSSGICGCSAPSVDIDGSSGCEFSTSSTENCPFIAKMSNNNSRRARTCCVTTSPRCHVPYILNTRYQYIEKKKMSC